MRRDPAVGPREQLVGQDSGGGRADASDIDRVHHARGRTSFRIEQVDECKVIGQTTSEIAVEHVDDLHADLHAGLPRRHGQRKTAAWNGDLGSRRALHLTARERAKRRFQLANELRRLEVPRHVGLAQADHLLRALPYFERSLCHASDPMRFVLWQMM